MLRGRRGSTGAKRRKFSEPEQELKVLSVVSSKQVY